MNWTPGPWECAPKDGMVKSTVSANLSADWGYVIWMPEPPFAMGATGAAICTANRDAEESEANAHLIAAAPELYAALRELRAWYGPGTAESNGAKCDTFWEAREQVDAALAKARGEAMPPQRKQA